MVDTGTAARVWSGWITFAGVLLAVLGVLNILEGLVALLQSPVAFIDGDSLVVVNLAGLGVVMIVFGALLLLSGLGLLARNQAARITAIVIVSLHAIVQVGWLGAYPVWSLLMIALSVVVLFALTVHWAPRPAESAAPAPNGGAHRADRDQQTREASFPMNQPRPAPAPANPAHAADQQPQQPARPAEMPSAPTSSGPSGGARR
jgi:hypothetical protein